MSRLAANRIKSEQDTDIDMVPIMNMFLVLIPFLLMSASFLHLKAINTSVPVMAESTNTPPKENDVKVTVVVEIGERRIKLSALSEVLDDDALNKLEAVITREKSEVHPLEQMVARLEGIKSLYPSSDTLILMPSETVLYDTIIQTMDAARNSGETPLFPNVVLSAKVS
jgi:biopolymer transport protein ExbD